MKIRFIEKKNKILCISEQDLFLYFGRQTKTKKQTRPCVCVFHVKKRKFFKKKEFPFHFSIHIILHIEYANKHILIEKKKWNEEIGQDKNKPLKTKNWTHYSWEVLVIVVVVVVKFFDLTTIMMLACCFCCCCYCGPIRYCIRWAKQIYSREKNTKDKQTSQWTNTQTSIVIDSMNNCNGFFSMHSYTRLFLFSIHLNLKKKIFLRIE